MLLYKVVLIVFLAVPLNGHKRRGSYSETYNIPEPRIEAYTPRGFSVSIEDTPGIRLFAFHGSINKELKDLGAGEFSKDILHSENGRWTFEDRRTRLREGDIIYYWLFVIKDDLGYRLDDGWFEVTELVDAPFETATTTRRPLRPRPTRLPVEPVTEAGTISADTSCNTIPPALTATTETPAEKKEREELLIVCQFSLFNVTQGLLSMQSQLDSLRKTNQQLTTLFEKYPDGRKLTLSGRIPTDEDALSTVKFIMRGKLNLNPDILNAVRKEDNSVVFELSTLAEKLEILEMAKDKLQNSRIILS